MSTAKDGKGKHSLTEYPFAKLACRLDYPKSKLQSIMTELLKTKQRTGKAITPKWTVQLALFQLSSLPFLLHE